MSRIERDDERFAPFRATLIASVDALHDADPAALGDHCHRVIRQALRRAHRLPPDPAQFQRWFRTACRHPDGTEYSPSQRAVFVQQFNRVGQHWATEGLLDEPLTVSNYRRRSPGGVADLRMYQTLRPAELGRLREAFLQSLEPPDEKPSPEAAYWTAFAAQRASVGAPWQRTSRPGVPWCDISPAGAGMNWMRRTCARSRPYH